MQNLLGLFFLKATAAAGLFSSAHSASATPDCESPSVSPPQPEKMSIERKGRSNVAWGSSSKKNRNAITVKPPCTVESEYRTIPVVQKCLIIEWF